MNIDTPNQEGHKRTEYTDIIRNATQELMKLFNQKYHRKTLNPLFTHSIIDKLLNSLIVRYILSVLQKHPLSKETKVDSSYFPKLISIIGEDKSLFSVCAKLALKRQLRKYGFTAITKDHKILYKTVTTDILAEFPGEMKKYQKRYGTFSDQTVLKIFLDMMIMFVTSYLSTSSTQLKRSWYALAILHPLTDDYLDKGLLDESFIKKVEKMINGTPVDCSNIYEEHVKELIDTIYSEFPQSQHPLLLQTFQQMYLAQIESMKQKQHTLSFDSITEISFQKGGISLLLATYLALTDLSPKYYRLYYQFGGLLQLIDDFMDISEDLKEQTTTIWTHSLAQKRGINPLLEKVISLSNALESEYRSFSFDLFSDPKAYRFICTFSAIPLIVLGYFINQQHLDIQSKRIIKPLLPLRYSFMMQIWQEYSHISTVENWITFLKLR